MVTSSRSSIVVLGLAWAVLGPLAIAVGIGISAVGQFAYYLAVFLPDFTPVQGPLTLVGTGFGICVEVVVVVTAVLVGYTRGDRIFRPSVLRWVDVLTTAGGAATVFAFTALFFVPGPPQLYTFAVAVVLVCLAITFVLLVLRSLLRRAVAMHVELDEVV